MWDLYRDNNFTKIFIPTCTPKKRCYRHIIIIYVLTVYVKIVSKKGYQMEKMSTKDLISYTDIKLHINGFNLCTPKNDAPNI